MTIDLTSSAFDEGTTLPSKYTRQGKNVSPPLLWSDAPQGTRTFVVILDDEDAPDDAQAHWVIYNIPGDTFELPEHVPPEPQLENGTRHGKNAFGKFGYAGPNPPPGENHHYAFQIYALDAHLKLPPGATKQDILGAIFGHILDDGRVRVIFRADENPSR